jgi:hypothetical protein
LNSISRSAMLADHLAGQSAGATGGVRQRHAARVERRDQRSRISPLRVPKASVAISGKIAPDERLEQPFCRQSSSDHCRCYPGRDRDAVEARRRDARRLEAFGEAGVALAEIRRSRAADRDGAGVRGSCSRVELWRPRGLI